MFINLQNKVAFLPKQNNILANKYSGKLEINDFACYALYIRFVHEIVWKQKLCFNLF